MLALDDEQASCGLEQPDTEETNLWPLGDFLERAGLGKQVRRAGNDNEPAQAFHAFVRLAIELEDLLVVAADNEQAGCGHARQRVSRRDQGARRVRRWHRPSRVLAPRP